MLPLSPYVKDAFEKFEQDFQATNLPEGKYRIFCNKRPHPINRPPPLFSTFAKFIFRGFGPLNSQHFCDSGIPKNGAF